ncbi:MAG: OmpL47-type beta-barrel domain-containing protein [Candidatus Thorarchaeota archaeon]
MLRNSRVCLLVVTFGFMLILIGTASIVTPVVDVNRVFQSPRENILGPEIDPVILASHTSHDPIRIEGDADFAAQASAEGWPGTGIEVNPYVIEGLRIEITSANQNGILILDTTVHFEIRNCYFTGAHGTDEYGAVSGIHLLHASNGYIFGNLFVDNGVGIGLGVVDPDISGLESNMNRIEENNFTNSGIGIAVFWSSNNELLGNWFRESEIFLWNAFDNVIDSNIGAPGWISLLGSSMNTINGNDLGMGGQITVLQIDSPYIVGSDDNTITNNVVSGIDLYESDYNLVDTNTISLGNDGIYISRCIGTTITNNKVFLCNSGIRVDESGRTVISNNGIMNNGQGLVLYGSRDTDVNGNGFIHNDVNAEVAGSLGGEVLHNNYWFDYTGVDANDDGIGDTPYVGVGFEDLTPLIRHSYYRMEITIDGDLDFETQALAEGWSGDGSSSHPYIIENYWISAEDYGHGISIKNLFSSEFVIRNCYLISGIYGVYLDEVETVAHVEDCTFFLNEYGIYGKTLMNNEGYTYIMRSDFYYNNIAVYQSMRGAGIYENNFVESVAGVYIEWTMLPVDLVQNVFSEIQGNAIHLYESIVNEIRENQISSLEGYGILLDACEKAYGSAILGNFVLNSQYGIYLTQGAGSLETRDFWVANNMFRGVIADAVDDGLGNIFETNVFWSYSGTDDNQDGIGDTSYILEGTAGNQDSYPLMGLWWQTPPSDQMIDLGQSFEYDLDFEPYVLYIGPSFEEYFWTGQVWSISDTEHFMIDSQGTITNIAPLSGGIYPLEVTVRGGGVLRGEFTLTVIAPNTPPVAADDAYETNEDEILIVPAPGILLNDDDVDYDPLEIYYTIPALIGGLSVNPDGSFTYEPAPDWFGEESFTYVLFDGTDYSNEATVTITVLPVNDLPVAVDDAYSVDEDNQLVVSMPGVLLNDFDVDGDPFAGISIVIGPSNGALELFADGSFVYTPGPDFSGIDMFTYIVSETGGGPTSNIATVTITVNPVNDAPVADAGGSYFADEGSSITFDASSSSDADGDQLQFRWDFDGDGNWDTEWSTDPTASYTWEDDFVGAVTVNVTDGEFFIIASATVTVYNVAPSVDAGEDQTINEGDSIDFSGSFTDLGILDTHSIVWDFGDGSPVAAETLSPSHVFSDPGVYLVTLTVTDDDEGVGVDSLTITVLDLTPPMTTASLDRLPDFAGWYHSGVIVTLEFTDTGSGVATTAYRYEGIPWTEYTGPFIFSLEGGKILEFNSTDFAGNVELTKTLEILIDKMAPVPTISLDGVLGEDNWYISDVTVTYSVADGDSGVGWCYFVFYNAQGTEWNLEETYYDGLASAEFILTTSLESGELWAWMNVSDVAGNWVIDELVFKVDKTPPETLMTIESSQWGMEDSGIIWTKYPVTLCFDWEFSSDATSGFALVDDTVHPNLYGVMYRIDGGEWVYLNEEQINPWLIGDPWMLYPEFQGRIPLTTMNSEGLHIIQWSSIDVAGNVEPIHEVTFGIDMTIPNVIPTISGSQNEGWFSTDVNVKFSATDSLSGLVDPMDGLGPIFSYSIDSGPITEGRLDTWFSFTTEGIHKFEVWIYDNAGPPGSGNVWTEELYIQIDKTAPETLMTTDISQYGVDINGDIWTSAPVTLCYDWEFSSDALSGFVRIYPDLYSVMYRIDGGEWVYLTEEQVYPWLIGDPWMMYPEFMGRVPLVTITGEGIHTVEWKSFDIAGNVESIHEVTFGIDQTIPNVTPIISGSQNEGWFSTDVNVKFSATDSLSGLVDPMDGLGPIFSYSIDSGPITEGRLDTWFSFTTEGIHKFEVWIYDNAGPPGSGNVWTEELYIQIDKTAPETTIFTERVPEGVEVTFSATDVGSGLRDSTYYSIDDMTTWAQYTGTFTLTAGGIVNIYYYSVDIARNNEPVKMESVVVDIQPPETIITLDGNIWNGWYSADVIVTLSVTDEGIGVATTEYSFDGVSWTTYTVPFTISTEGVHTIYYNSTDYVGNVELTKTQEIRIDKTIPVPTISLVGTLGNYEWFTSDVTVVFSMTDTLSGVGESHFLLNDAQGSWNEYHEYEYYGAGSVDLLLTVSIESGEIWAYLNTSDVAGNWVLAEKVFKIDKTPPDTTIGWSGIPSSSIDGWFGDPVEIVLSATDDLSGVAMTEYSFDLITWHVYSESFFLDTDGEHTVYFRSTDVAGNVEETDHILPFKVDLTHPECTIELAGIMGDNGWYVSDVTVTITLTDVLSGIDEVYVQFSSVYPEWNELFIYHFSGEQSVEIIHTLSLESKSISISVLHVDIAGNDDQIGTHVFIDKTAPETGLSYVQIPGVGSVVTLTVSDTTSGVASILYSLDGVDWQVYDAPFTLSSGGIVDVHFYAVDKAGNVESVNVAPVEVDVEPPVTTYSLDGTIGLGGWYTSHVIVALSATDDIMGVDFIAYSFDNVVWFDYTSPFTVSNEGLTNVYFNATDKVGNMESTQVIEIYIDKTAPTTSLIIGTPSFGFDPTYVSTTTEFALDATDTPSDVNRIEYRIDLGEWIQYVTPFTIPNIGAHTISYRSFDMAGNEGTTLSLSIVVNAAGIFYSGDTSGNYSDPIILEAQLLDLATQLPLEGMTVTFVLGTQTVSAVTGPDGFASSLIILDQPAGNYPLTVLFESDDMYMGTSVEVTFVLEKEQATASYTGSTVVSSLLETFELRATVFDDDDGHWGDMTYIYVTFTIYSNEMDINSPILVDGPYVVGITNVDGVGVALTDIVNLPVGTYLIVVSFEADHNIYYQGPDSDTVSLTIYEPSGDFVTGGGWIWDSSGHKGHFGFVVKYKSDGTLKGCFIYIYRDGDWLVIIKSTEWIGLAIVDNHAYFEAEVSIMQFNFRTFEYLWSVHSHTIKVDAWDNDCIGEDDVFQMQVYDENGLLWHEAGFNPYGYLEGGNVKIHRRDD